MNGEIFRDSAQRKRDMYTIQTKTESLKLKVSSLEMGRLEVN
jgi:hypothetical protein